MGITWLRREDSEAPRRPSGPVILFRAAVLVLCLFGLAGCPGPSSSSAGPPLSSVLGASKSQSPSPSATQSCFTSTAYVRRDGTSSPRRGAVLTAAQEPVWDIPEPDVNIDSARSEGEDPLDEQSWAQDGVNNANLVQPPQSGTEQPTEANLLAEAKGVVATEDSTLLTADINDLESDPDYGDQICAALTLLNNAIKAFTIDPTNVPQVVSYLQGLASSNNPAPDDLASVFNDAANKFDSVFPTCGGTLDVTTWLIDQIQSLFCPNS